MRIRDLSGQVSAEQFEEAMGKFHRMGEGSRRAAYLVLVEGKTYAAAMEIVGIKHRAQVHQLVSKIAAEIRPDGWVTATVTLPPKLMAEVKTMEQQAKQSLIETMGL